MMLSGLTMLGLLKVELNLCRISTMFSAPLCRVPSSSIRDPTDDKATSCFFDKCKEHFGSDFYFHIGPLFLCSRVTIDDSLHPLFEIKPAAGNILLD